MWIHKVWYIQTNIFQDFIESLGRRVDDKKKNFGAIVCPWARWQLKRGRDGESFAKAPGLFTHEDLTTNQVSCILFLKFFLYYYQTYSSFSLQSFSFALPSSMRDSTFVAPPGPVCDTLSPVNIHRGQCPVWDALRLFVCSLCAAFLTSWSVGFSWTELRARFQSV